MQTIIQTPLERAIIAFEERQSLKFVPDEKFYKKVGINQKRFGMLTKGKLKIFAFEAKNLSDFFGTPIQDLF